MRKIIILHILVISITSSLFAQKQDSIQGVIIYNENNINTSSLEFSPSFYEDGIVYISTQDVEKAQKKNDTRINKISMSIYEAKRDASGRLSNPVPFSADLTSKYHEGPLSFNHTGDIVFFTRSNLDGKKAKKSKDGFTHLRIYSADKVGNTWKNIQDMPFNSDDFDCVHPTISADGNKLYFASDRPGGLGGMDIWVTTKSGTTWGEPVNLGPGINSKGNDAFPYIHPDGSLYYASDGRGGAGGYDIFYASESGDTWTEARAMPYPFNAAGDDFGLIVDQESKNGYFTSNRSLGRGEDDIYSFNAIANLKDLLNNNATKKHNETLTINVADKITGEAIEGASVSVLNLDELTLANVFSMLDEQGKLIQVQSEANNPNDLVLNVDVDANGQTALTDHEGKHVFSVAKGNFIAKVSKAGYKTKQVEIPASANVKETLVLLEKGENTVKFNGMVIDEKLNAPIAGAKVTIQEEGSDKIETVYSNKAGKFDYDMQKGKNYIVTTEKNGVKETKRISVPADGNADLTVAFNGINSDYDGKGFVEGAVIRLPNIYYNFNDASIRPDAQKDLNALISILKQVPEINIELASHTDSRGSTQYNKSLSQKRANNAIKYLTDGGVKKNRLKGVGYGESNLKNGCKDGVACSELDHQINRRTEFKITKMKAGLNVMYLNNQPEVIGGPSNVSSTENTKSASTTEIVLNPSDYANANELIIIAGTFTDKSNAQKRLKQVQSSGYEQASLSQADNPTMSAVIVKSVKDPTDAINIVKDLKSKGLKSYIKKK